MGSKHKQLHPFSLVSVSFSYNYNILKMYVMSKGQILRLPGSYVISALLSVILHVWSQSESLGHSLLYSVTWYTFSGLSAMMTTY